MEQAPTERPKFLKVLCILSFIAISSSILLNLMGLVGGRLTPDQMKKGKLEILKEVRKLEDGKQYYLAEVQRSSILLKKDLNDNFFLALFINVTVSLLGLFSVLYMWKGIRLGFHGYIIYSLLFILSVYVYSSADHVHSFMIYGGLFAAAIFIFMYSRNLKWMK